MFCYFFFFFLKTIISVFPVLKEKERERGRERERERERKREKERGRERVCKSLIKSRNNKGASADPCGTPCVDISLLELYSLIVVY